MDFLNYLSKKVLNELSHRLGSSSPDSTSESGNTAFLFRFDDDVDDFTLRTL